ncbi:MAG TPA: S8 family serine peptidase, partial [Micromonosporaceae bacterium]|nr:S8 family serine peptidase [Micromonosporaceae bacterium]
MMMHSRTLGGVGAICAVLLMSPLPASADSVRDREWIISALNLASAHRLSEGKGVVVAVIDSGVDASHHDLSGNVLSGADFSSGDVSSGDGHTDTLGHGTGVAGIIAAHGHGPRDESGVLGIAPKAKILPVRDGAIFGDEITVAVQWATAHGASVMCIAQGDVLGGA